MCDNTCTLNIQAWPEIALNVLFKVFVLPVYLILVAECPLLVHGEQGMISRCCTLCRYYRDFSFYRFFFFQFGREVLHPDICTNKLLKCF